VYHVRQPWTPAPLRYMVGMSLSTTIRASMTF
jgi:hypothetical protein